ncbi:sigma-70 family RNA polymerase sigma factor [Salinisphaera sp. RV14]|uniref:sigma-70 family RNA polymerase sigma factor n=1 Tax=unclassified Salinisphaera TaxID=2649847 RepID=UPI003F84DC70
MNNANACPSQPQPPTTEEAVRNYALWIKRTALYMRSTMPWADLEELIQWGTVGLLEALERFDPSRGKPFEAFANRRIRGAMIDSLRREGREASRVATPHAAEQTIGRSAAFDDPADRVIAESERTQLTEYIAQLPQRQQTILHLFYIEEHNNREIAQALEVSEAYISKTRRQAIERIAELMRNDNPNAGGQS